MSCIQEPVRQVCLIAQKSTEIILISVLFNHYFNHFKFRTNFADNAWITEAEYPENTFVQ